MKTKILQIVAKIGYASRGVTYFIVGFYALLASLNLKSIIGTKGAVKSLHDLPFGDFAVASLAIGFAFYAIWRLIQSLLDADEIGKSIKSLLIRGGLLASALSHIFLSYWCVKALLFNFKSEKKFELLKVFDSELVRYALIFLSFVFACIGFAQIYKGVLKKYSQYLIDDSIAAALDKLCQFGIILRGVAFIIFGYYLFRIGATIFEEEQSKSTIKSSLLILKHQPMGEYLLATMGLGLMAFAGYSFVMVWHRDVSIEKSK